MSIIKEKGSPVLIKSLRRMSTLIAAPLVTVLLGLAVMVALVPQSAQAADIPAKAAGVSSVAYIVSDQQGATSLASSPANKNNYSYTYSWKIGPATKTRTPAYVTKDIERVPQLVFPFTIYKCTKLTPGEVCVLYVEAFLGTVRVTMPSAASFRFTVIAKGYFDAPGSTITFTISDQKGSIYLAQHGVAIDPDEASQIAYKTGVIKAAWRAQACRLQALLGLPTTWEANAYSCQNVWY
jgi:hypothetical protein